MSNELLFFIHIAVVLLCTFIALKLGKHALITLFSFEAVLANLFVIKQIPLFGFIVTPSDVFAIGGLISLNLLREYYGKKVSIKALWTALMILLFFGLMAKFQLIYRPDAADTTHNAFNTILSNSPRILFASIFVFFFVQLLDLKLFQLLRNKWNGGKMVIRFGISICISELLDTFLFSFIGLYGLVSQIWHIVLFSFAIKLLTLLVMTPTLVLTKRLVKPYEPI